MAKVYINNNEYVIDNYLNITLLDFLRDVLHLTSAKDGCSGEGTCGACLVEADGKPRLACTLPLTRVEGSKIYTLEGIPENVKKTIATSFVANGAVQCGFCTPGFVMRTKILLQNNPNPSPDEIKQALKLNLCRCTGYKKIEKAIADASLHLKNNTLPQSDNDGSIGKSYPKYQAYEAATGERKFADDLYFEGMLFGALRFSDYPKAIIKEIDITAASAIPGVVKIFTAKDIPGQRFTGLIFNDWPLMISTGETTRCISDVLAGVVAVDRKTAREAARLIKVEYEILKPVTDPHEALLTNAPQVHPNRNNLLDRCFIKSGDVDNTIAGSVFSAHGIFHTQRIEHAFIEKEAAVALPEKNGIVLYSQGQGIYEDRRQVASLLGLPEDKVRVVLMPSGGGFGGKEDLTVQGHVALFAYLLQKPVKLTLSRPESIRMHPKRHPVYIDMTIGCDKSGKLTALKVLAIGDTGAYASVGNKVMERVAGHANGGYHFPVTQVEALTVYTNNIPCGAMRGFGVNQSAFAVETLIDELCEKGGFDRWQFRFDNALDDGLTTATGQKLKDVGIKKCLLALKDDFYRYKFTGIATGIKNSGIGNGMIDYCDCIIEIVNDSKVKIHHGWTEMGQGVQNVAIQTLYTETGINPALVEIINDTSSDIKTGMTTSSRATVLLGNAIIDACKKLKFDLEKFSLQQLSGKTYKGSFVCDWTTKPGSNAPVQITHYSYGYAAQLAVLDNNGKLEKIIAAHDAGKIYNRLMFEGQMEGAIHMGTGYALSEDLPMKDGFLVSEKLRDCGVLRAHETPEIIIREVEVHDSVGPYGAKGIGEIGLVPTAPAIANAFYQFDKVRRYRLPLEKIKKAQ